MTKVSVFGQEATEQKKLKPIEFVKTVYSDGTIAPAPTSPKDWDNVVLYKATRSKSCLDFILAFNDNETGAIFLGHWNDGVV